VRVPNEFFFAELMRGFILLSCKQFILAHYRLGSGANFAPDRGSVRRS
jgi:hypothetical protein